MNVALAIDGLDAGGAESVVCHLARGLTARGHRTYVYCLKSAGTRAAQLQDAGVIVREANSRGFDPTLAWRLWRWLVRDGVNVVHAHSSAALVYTFAPARLAGIPLIQTRHGKLVGRPSRHRRPADRLAPFVARVTIVSESLRQDLPAAIARDSPLVPNGIDLQPEPRRAARAGLETLCGRPLDGPIVLSVGTISVEKDTCGLLRAFAMLRHKQPRAELICIGGSRDPAYLARVESIRRSEGLSGCTHLLGPLDRAERFMTGADVFCLASRTEAAPMTIIEAMSRRVPIVATAVGDVGSLDAIDAESSKMLRQAATGLLVPPGAPRALADALQTVLCEPDAARRRASAAARDYASRFGAERMIRNYERVYSDCVRLRQEQFRGHGRVADPATRRKPRVLMVGPAPPTVGGMVSAIDALTAGRLRERYDLYRFATCGASSEHRRSVWNSMARHVAAMSRLGHVIVARRINLIHIHTCSRFSFYRSLVDLLIGKLLGRRVILHIHGGQFDRFCRASGGAGRVLIRRGCEVADGVVVLSRGWCDRISPYAGRARLAIVPNGIDFARSHRPSRLRAEKLPCRFVFLGALTRGKGMPELLEAAAMLHGDGVRFELLIAGPKGGPAEPDWPEHVRLVGLRRIVSFVGVVTGTAKRGLLASADCLVLPSHVEGLPIVILEAASFALPVIASDVGSVAELLTAGEPGGGVREICPLVPAGDSAALTRQMSRLARDAALRREMGRALHEHAARHFSADVQVERLARVYSGILPRRDEPRTVAARGSQEHVRRAATSPPSRSPSLVAGKSV